MLNPPTSFKRSDYFAWVNVLRQGREIVPATSRRPQTNKWLAIQHDVDLSLDWALQFAEEEAELGINACYYVQVGCPFYDIASPSSVRTIARLNAMGHSIGLHFDPRKYQRAGIDLVHGLVRDLQILSAVAGFKVDYLWAHKPFSNNFDVDRLITLGLKTPQVEDEVYISDSAGAFRDNAIEALTNPPDRLRFNTHPCHWRNHGTSYPLHVNAILHRAKEEALLPILEEVSDLQTSMAIHPGRLEQNKREGTSNPRDDQTLAKL